MSVKYFGRLSSDWYLHSDVYKITFKKNIKIFETNFDHSDIYLVHYHQFPKF